MQLTVRRTLRDDGALLKELRVASLSDAPWAFGAKLEDVLAEPVHAYHEVATRHSSSNRSTSFLLFADSTAVGTVGAFFEQTAPNRAFVCALWVRPQFRGGTAATELMHNAIEWLRARGASEVFAWVADRNSRALGFYRKLGFRPTPAKQPLPSNPAETETLLRYATVDG
jgi:ribosomal protein S18 acetylase RimI-like enzyme